MIDTPAIRKAATLADQVYEFSYVGGDLHILLDDWNVEDNHLDFCATAIEENIHELSPENQEIERQCLAAFKELSEEERYSALAIREGYTELV